MPKIVKKSNLSAALAAGKSKPLWAGPSAAGPSGGITNSMLQKWLVCRERFRLAYVEGLAPPQRFSRGLEFGNLWHACEEGLASSTAPIGFQFWHDCLEKYVAELLTKYPMDRNEVFKWYNVCKQQFPLYVEYWSQHPDVANRTPLLQEQVFDVPYRLPSGRTVRLRGKWDSVDLIGGLRHWNADVPKGLWLQENKTKGDIDEQQMQRQLTFDLQTMLYMIALHEDAEGFWQTVREKFSGMGRKPFSILGVRYNVVRRPLSGGKGTIKQGEGTQGSKCPKCKGTGLGSIDVKSGDRSGKCVKCGGAGRVNAKSPESDEDYYDRLAHYIKDEPEHYFMRWTVPISASDIEVFRRTCLDPILEQLCDWYEQVTRMDDPWQAGNSLHFRFPYGVYNSLIEGDGTPYDEYFATGSTVGLCSQTKLFPELEGA